MVVKSYKQISRFTTIMKGIKCSDWTETSGSLEVDGVYTQVVGPLEAYARSCAAAAGVQRAHVSELAAYQYGSWDNLDKLDNLDEDRIFSRSQHRCRDTMSYPAITGEISIAISITSATDKSELICSARGHNCLSGLGGIPSFGKVVQAGFGPAVASLPRSTKGYREGAARSWVLTLPTIPAVTMRPPVYETEIVTEIIVAKSAAAA